MNYVPPVIVIPGITASYLRDDYTLPPEIVWSVRTKNYERSSLHPDNTRYEAVEPARVVPDQIFEIAYRELVEELRYNLSRREDQPTPVFPFSYDWRQPLEATELELREFILEVIERTKLLQHYHKTDFAGDPRVNLVGHSMGGLIIAGYLQRYGAEASVRKVATLATPYRGSFEAVIKTATGTANLGTAAPSSREREAARATPALYYLMPSLENRVTDQDGSPISLFEVDTWQPSILATIEEYVRLHGLERRDQKRQARRLFEGFLNASAKHRGRIEGLKLAQCGLDTTDWLCVVGVDAETRVRLEVHHRRSSSEFNFQSSDRANGWDEDDVELRRLTGDGTVPFEGGLPGFLGEQNIVCVRPSDFGYWELADRALSSLAGFHGILPNMNMLHRLIVRHFTGRPDRHKNTWGRPAPGVTDAEWKPPIEGLHNKE